jgi:hypothetical protein
MNHGGIAAVEIRQGIAQLVDPLDDLVLVEEYPLLALLLHRLAEICSLDEVHHQVFPIAFVEGIGDLGQVGVIQPGQGGCFSVKLPTRLGHGRRRGIRVRTNLFDRADPTLQSEVLCPVHSAHAALADDRHDFIPSTQDGVWFKQASQGVFSLPFVVAGNLSSSPLFIIDDTPYSVKEER